MFNPRRLRVGHPYRLVFDRAGELRRFEYHVDNDQFLRVSNAVQGYAAALVPYVKERGEVAMRGQIDPANNSLVAAIDAGGESVMLAIEMAEIFSGEIDFNNDLRRGDHFEVLFEKVYREDQFSGYGDVLASEFVNDGRRLQAFRFHVPGESEAQYFDENGRSMKRLFLRSPFRFEPRVTSRFSYRRLHPVLGGVRPHLGVDYGRADRHAGYRRRQWHGGVRGHERRFRQHGPYPAHERLRDVLLASLRVREGHAARRPRHARADDRAGGIDRTRNGSASRLPHAQERRVRQSVA